MATTLVRNGVAPNKPERKAFALGSRSASITTGISDQAPYPPMIRAVPKANRQPIWSAVKASSVRGSMATSLRSQTGAIVID